MSKVKGQSHWESIYFKPRQSRIMFSPLYRCRSCDIVYCDCTSKCPTKLHCEWILLSTTI